MLVDLYGKVFSLHQSSHGQKGYFYPSVTIVACNVAMLQHWLLSNDEPCNVTKPILRVVCHLFMLLLGALHVHNIIGDGNDRDMMIMMAVISPSSGMCN